MVLSAPTGLGSDFYDAVAQTMRPDSGSLGKWERQEPAAFHIANSEPQPRNRQPRQGAVPLLRVEASS